MDSEEFGFEVAELNNRNLLDFSRTICSTAEFVDTVALMFASFYIFNVEFHMMLKSTQNLFTKHVFGIADLSGTKDEKIAQLCLELNYFFIFYYAEDISYY